MTDGEKVKAIRKALGLSQEVFGAQIGVTKSHMSGVESGSKNLSGSALQLLKVKYSISTQWWESCKGEMFEKKVGEPNNFGPSLEDQLAFQEWQTFSPDQKLQAVQMLRRLKAGSKTPDQTS